LPGHFFKLSPLPGLLPATAEKILEATPQSRIVFVTSDGDADVKAAALATGAEAYLAKARAASELLPTIAVTLDE
jgi:DNA-binding NarL/FixJ family response regulator